MTGNTRDPHSDNDLIDAAHEAPTPSQSGSSGGGMQREIGSRDEEATATGADPQPTSVHKGDKPNQGHEPTLPNRDGSADDEARVPPRRTS